MRALGRGRRAEPVELAPRDAYAKWADAYPPEPHNALMALEERAVRALLPDAAGRRTLDLGCGTGRHLRLLSERGAASVVGIDLSREMLARAAAFRGRVLAGDLRALPFPLAIFDGVVAGLVLGHVAELETAWKEIARVLAPAGWAVVSDMHPDGARAGWRRTFRARDGRTYAARHHVHDLADHVRACAAAGLAVEETCEPPIDFDHEWRGRPAILALRVRRAR